MSHKSPKIRLHNQWSLANTMSSSLRLLTKFEIFTDSKSIFWITQNYSWLVRVPDLVGPGQSSQKLYFVTEIQCRFSDNLRLIYRLNVIFHK